MNIKKQKELHKYPRGKQGCTLAAAGCLATGLQFRVTRKTYLITRPGDHLFEI